LERIRAALPPARTAVAVPRGYRGAHGIQGDADAPPPLDPTALLDLLVDRLEDYRATVHRCPPEQMATVLAALLHGRVVVPDGFPSSWLGAVSAELVRDDPPLTPQALDATDAVVTTCTLAIAETGTVVLDGSAGQGRRALTLVPDRHVLVVEAAQVVATVPRALARLDARRPQTWISGPSATSDIELQRVEGVHGPRRLEVVLIG